VDGGEGTCALHELDEFVVVADDPLAVKRTSQCRSEREGLTRRVHVEDGGTHQRGEQGGSWYERISGQRGGGGTRGTRRQKRERRDEGRCRGRETLDKRRERKKIRIKTILIG
jgi:hypothetical protein